MSLAGSKRTRTKVQCFCIKCNGTLVDPRTKKSHMSRRIINYQETGPSWLPDEMNDIEMDDNGTDDEMDDDNEMDGNEMNDNEMDDNEMEYPLHIFLTKKLPINKSAKYQKVKKEEYQIEFSNIYYQMMTMMISQQIQIMTIKLSILKNPKMKILKTMTMKWSTLHHQISMMMSPNFLLILSMIHLLGLFCGYFNFSNDINFPMSQ